MCVKSSHRRTNTQSAATRKFHVQQCDPFTNLQKKKLFFFASKQNKKEKAKYFTEFLCAYFFYCGYGFFFVFFLALFALLFYCFFSTTFYAAHSFIKAKRCESGDVIFIAEQEKKMFYSSFCCAAATCRKKAFIRIYDYCCLSFFYVCFLFSMFAFAFFYSFVCFLAFHILFCFSPGKCLQIGLLNFYSKNAFAASFSSSPFTFYALSLCPSAPLSLSRYVILSAARALVVNVFVSFAVMFFLVFRISRFHVPQFQFMFKIRSVPTADIQTFQNVVDLFVVEKLD